MPANPFLPSCGIDEDCHLFVAAPHAWTRLHMRSLNLWCLTISDGPSELRLRQWKYTRAGDGRCEVLQIESPVVRQCDRRAQNVHQEGDVDEGIVKFTLKPSEECKVGEIIPSQCSDAAGVESRKERVNEGRFGDPVTSAGLNVLGASLTDAGGLLLNANHPRCVSFSRRRREGGWGPHWPRVGDWCEGGALSQDAQREARIRTLRPCRKHDLIARCVIQTAPLEDGTVVASPFPTQVVGPDGSNASEGVSVRIVPTIDRLSLDIPPDLRSLAKTVIDESPLISRAKPGLRGRVTNNRNAIASKPSPKCAAVCTPMLSSQRRKERQREPTCV